MEVNAWLKEAIKAKVGLFLSVLRPAHAVPLVNGPQFAAERALNVKRDRRGHRARLAPCKTRFINSINEGRGQTSRLEQHGAASSRAREKTRRSNSQRTACRRLVRADRCSSSHAARDEAAAVAPTNPSRSGPDVTRRPTTRAGRAMRTAAPVARATRSIDQRVQAASRPCAP